MLYSEKEKFYQRCHSTMQMFNCVNILQKYKYSHKCITMYYLLRVKICYNIYVKREILYFQQSTSDGPNYDYNFKHQMI